MRRRWLPVPGQQFGEPVDRVGADAGDDVGEPGFGLDAVHAGRTDQWGTSWIVTVFRYSALYTGVLSDR